MKPEELQLGDIVTTTPSGMPIKVVAIHRKKVAYHACTDRFSWVRIGLLRPIPLTPEILEKNGFKECTNGDWTNDNVDFILYRREDGIFHIQNTNMTLPYVSSFQHALRLCGINKEIEL